MDFFSQCVSILIPKTLQTGEQVYVMLACKKCGHKDIEKNGKVKTELKVISHNPKQTEAVMDKEKELYVEPTLPIECPRCGNNKGYVWQVQTRGADQSSTQFLRCTNCGYTFRECT